MILSPSVFLSARNKLGSKIGLSSASRHDAAWLEQYESEKISRALEVSGTDAMF